MVIEVRFKGRDMEFRGKSYDFELAPDVAVPAVGSIIRMEDLEGKAVCNRTRVRVENVKESSSKTQGLIRYTMSSLDEPSIAKK